jgi:hypothetical protein
MLFLVSLSQGLFADIYLGLPKEPNNWAKTPPVTSGGKVTHAKGAINQFYVPEVLGSSPRVEQDHETARSLYSAMRVCIPPWHLPEYIGIFPS